MAKHIQNFDDLTLESCKTVRNPGISQVLITVIKYRPQRGSLDEAMQESREFISIKEMFDTIASESNGLFQTEDLIIDECTCKDERINWKESRMVCTKRFGDITYDVPQCIGFCSIE